MVQEGQEVKLHREAISAEQEEVLRGLGPVMEGLSFYLGGGTAVALHLGHRRSLDLDWFTHGTIGDSMVLASEISRGALSLESTSAAPGTLHAVARGVKLSFFSYEYPLLSPLVALEDYGCCMASLSDLAAMKLSAVAQRGSRRDFLDIYAIGKWHISLRDMLSLYVQKFGTPDTAHLLYGLSYFDDADREPMPPLLREGLNWETVKSGIGKWIKELADLG